MFAFSVGQYLETSSFQLYVGATVLMAAGAILLLCHRAPIQRQRIGELSLVAVAAWLVIPFLPQIPRDESVPASDPSIVMPTPDPKSLDGMSRDLNPSMKASPADNRESLTTTTKLPMRGVSGNTPAIELALENKPREMSATVIPKAELDRASPESVERPQQSTLGWLLALESRTDLRLAEWGLPVWWCTGLLLGMTCSVWWLMMGRIQLAIYRWRASEPDQTTQAVYRELAASRVRPLLLVSSTCNRSVSWGLLRPVILIPRRIAQAEPRLLRSVLRHELAHVEQRDAWGHAVANALLPFFVFPPALLVAPQPDSIPTRVGCGRPGRAGSTGIIRGRFGRIGKGSATSVGQAGRSDWRAEFSDTVLSEDENVATSGARAGNDMPKALDLDELGDVPRCRR